MANLFAESINNLLGTCWRHCGDDDIQMFLFFEKSLHQWGCRLDFSYRDGMDPQITALVIRRAATKTLTDTAAISGTTQCPPSQAEHHDR